MTDLRTEAITAEVEETGDTFEQNAVIKAVAYRETSGMATLADDSGLCVDALGGRPGVRSARYAGEHATDRENVQRLLCDLRGVPCGHRTARFECVIALALPSEGVVTFSGSVEGAIAMEPAGQEGFGYDPVFIPDRGEGDGLTMAQLSRQEKAGLSHRAMAARKAAEWLSRSLEGRAGQI